MAASICKATVDVSIEVPESVKRLRALELAVEARGPVAVHDADRTVGDAEKYLAFLNGETVTTD